MLLGIYLVHCSIVSNKEYLMHQQPQNCKEWKHVQKWLSLIPLKIHPNNLGSSHSEVFSKTFLSILPFENPCKIRKGIL